MRQRLAELEKLEFVHKQAEMAMQVARKYAEAIIETVREPLVVLDAHLKVLPKTSRQAKRRLRSYSVKGMSVTKIYL